MFQRTNVVRKQILAEHAKDFSAFESNTSGTQGYVYRFPLSSKMMHWTLREFIQNSRISISFYQIRYGIYSRASIHLFPMLWFVAVIRSSLIPSN